MVSKASPAEHKLLLSSMQACVCEAHDSSQAIREVA